MRIYLIRHAESESNIQDDLLKTKKDEDIEITPEGQKQAAKAGYWLKRYLQRAKAGNVKVWSSPYKRAQQTADIIVPCLHPEETMPYDIRTHPELREQNLGAFAGHSMEERAQLFPVEHSYFQQEWEAKRSYWAPRPGGESREDTAKRMDAFIPSLHEDAVNGVTDCVVIGHGIAHRLLVKQLTGKSVEEFDQEPNPENCHVRMLEMDKQGKVTDCGYVYKGNYLASDESNRTGSQSRI